ncbi:MAG: galactose-1-phosphate uridylyltransferase [Ilumatobacter coccineus]|uniref:Galactose-1-phosphate uridylyltransferase n=1 Tax=Ilumatobacter coccineus TaxID=467094 RepID=A0A2G6KH30_9ACTN|nr:MAG: galactose-1-phosphate uridylyltransferase [Ilumatobacter coccineus]
MSQMRLNQLTGRWVTIVAERAERPTDFAPRSDSAALVALRPCPFCPGHDTSEPTYEKCDDDGAWSLRILPNLYPAFDGDEGFAVHNHGPIHVSAEGTGLHEVFVYTPEHDAALNTLNDDQAGDFMLALKTRFHDHADRTNIRYTQAIVNHGREAGASVAHPHGQILGLPFVPNEILSEERAFSRFAGGCLLCTTVEAELVAEERVVMATDDVLVVCPYWSGSPYELLIIPRHHETHLENCSDEGLIRVGQTLRDVTKALNSTLGDVAYNVGFHTAPHHHSGTYHWHIHIWPNLMTLAGFERGTGVMINIVPPEQAAEILRSAITQP